MKNQCLIKDNQGWNFDFFFLKQCVYVCVCLNM